MPILSPSPAGSHGVSDSVAYPSMTKDAQCERACREATAMTACLHADTRSISRAVRRVCHGIDGRHRDRPSALRSVPFFDHTGRHFRRLKTFDATSRSKWRVLAHNSPKCHGKQQGWTPLAMTIRCSTHVTSRPALSCLGFSVSVAFTLFRC